MKTSLILVHGKNNSLIKRGAFSGYLRVRLPIEPGHNSRGGFVAAKFVPAHKIGVEHHGQPSGTSRSSEHVPDRVEIGGWSLPCEGLKVGRNEYGDRLVRIQDHAVNVLAELDDMITAAEEQIRQCKATQEILVAKYAEEGRPATRKDVQL